jgi:lactate dehydrogenase-like 2-hydroxyacid dehydrogenase
VQKDGRDSAPRFQSKHLVFSFSVKEEGGLWMKIIVFEVEDWERQAFESLQAEHQIEFVAGPLTPENAGTYSDAEAVSPFIYSDLSADVLRHMGRLKLIATRSTGLRSYRP